MKQVSIILFAALLIVSCSENKDTGSIDEIINSKDLERMRAKKTEVLASYDSIGDIIKRLEEAIVEVDSTKKYPLVTSFKIQDTTFNSYISLQGSVETEENILIYPEYQGVLTRVYVQEGQKVRKGQLLARIDDGGLSNQLSQLEAQYQLAKTTYERQERLWNQKIGSEIQYLQAKTNMESSKSAVDQLRSQLGKTSITAPFSGTIDDVITEQGQVVSPGQAVMRIVNLGDMYVKASIPETYLQSVTQNKNVEVNFPALDKTVTGKIKTVSSYINPNNRTFEVEIDVPNKDNSIKPNLMANLKINNYSKDKAITIPTDAIQENAKGDKYVFVITDLDKENNAVAKQVQVETGLSQDGMIEVTKGLSSEDAIVLDGALTLKDGTKITLKTTN
ncbi:efflux RND transporter periplasmic adaptor subunit [Mesonia sp. K7]|uniref:efflux RND transporter periplasmic adaptor subunit n=1 Tax=Mesonia sp. K7 TaxID=2218606 RepID=UPI000DA97CF5|nr:efflux RND transporter periplasmic adaptor subunit [Mesonia sp. K7]PZD78431.1 efflux RND transporter periplasmic adaptor subunit [Mesonia sp. K7]